MKISSMIFLKGNAKNVKFLIAISVLIRLFVTNAHKIIHKIKKLQYARKCLIMRLMDHWNKKKCVIKQMNSLKMELVLLVN